ncbi:hypothetical protein M422DRAFT_250592 [Sphaerobolus stellatus SS14]|uniref:Uncharacterized protein n=1 Tax=Sphaerobolus stellatus (strain SS14) TaxID=990650 RepID=A0A0C9VTA2_SPHS4|nr:hypothetical protein M422DRAFT_250592 [Sphaerobolus stellatus SS14]
MTTLKHETVERILEQVSDERKRVRCAGRGCASDVITAAHRALFHLPSTAVLTAPARPYSETASLVISIFTQCQSTFTVPLKRRFPTHTPYDFADLVPFHTPCKLT